METQPTAITTFGELVQLFAADGDPIRVDAAEQVVERSIQAPPLHSIIVARWEKTLPLLHLLCPIVDGITEERLADAETAVCRANNAAVLPGFGIDYGKHAVYFRLSHPVVDGLTTRTLDALFESLVGHARDYLKAFTDVVRDGAPGEGINDLAESWIAAHR